MSEEFEAEREQFKDLQLQLANGRVLSGQMIF